MKELTVGHFLKWVLRRSSQIQILINDWQTGHSSSFWFLFLLELWPVYSQSFIGFVRLHAFPDDTLASISPLILYSFVCWPVCPCQGMPQARRRRHFSLVPPSFSYLFLINLWMVGQDRYAVKSGRLPFPYLFSVAQDWPKATIIWSLRESCARKL